MPATYSALLAEQNLTTENLLLISAERILRGFMDILFENAKVITMDEAAPYLENAYVAVKGGKIVYIGEAAPQEQAKRRIDARGKLLMPGLINGHTHVPMTLFRG